MSADEKWPNGLRMICAMRCGDEHGDPPCWDVVPDCEPCDECVVDAAKDDPS